MAVPYSVDTCRQLAKAFDAADVVRPMRIERYDAGDELTYTVTGVAPAVRADVRVAIDKFVGGGFAGQVYRVKVLSVEGGEIAGLEVGKLYAMKILIPPAAGSVRFRNFIYWLGFQSPFSLQVNPDAARAGALWQKFIRRAASIEFGTELAVVDILATFVDDRMGSCGELSEWLEGRNWAFEVDDHLFRRKKWRVGNPLAPDEIGAPEYRAKKDFMARIVQLFHKIGAPELARQYEWWTCKSQPNCLKRLDCEGDPSAGLTAVDFRAGLALLAYLPMSPGDVKLICDGLFKRGTLVQFDRGNIQKLEAFIAAHPDKFTDMGRPLLELKQRERAYRDSMIDVTHNHVRLLSSRRLWGSIFDAGVESWRVRNMVDPGRADRFGASRIKTAMFAAMGMIIGLASTVKAVSVLGLVFSLIWAGIGKLVDWNTATPLSYAKTCVLGLIVGLAGGAIGRLIRAMWGRADLRKHYGRMFTNVSYFLRASRARIAEQMIAWHRDGRVSAERADRVGNSPLHYYANLPLSILPPGLHRFCADWKFAADRLHFIVTRPFKLYFNAEVREQWMRDMIDTGLDHGMISQEEADTVRRQLSEPFIQKYLKSLAVHVCTLPVTQIVSVLVAFIYWDPTQSWAVNSARAAAILAAFQITPISPGSLVRGLYVVGMVIKDRNYKDYKIAVWMGFWKYIGYLSFPIQMAYSYPIMARFMASHWATGAVHIIPVFGEHGALAEHAVFDLFYNRPLTLRRLMAKRAERRATIRPRKWHWPLIAVAACAVVALAPTWLAMMDGKPFDPVINGWLVTLAGGIGAAWTCWLAGGASTGSRVTMGALTGLGVGVLTWTASIIAAAEPLTGPMGWELAKPLLMPTFASTLVGVLVTLIIELNPPKD